MPTTSPAAGFLYNMTSPGNTSHGNWTEEEGEVMSHALGAWIVVLCVVYGVLSVAGVLGNSLVIYAVSRYEGMRTITNMFIVNLALADLSYCASLPFMITTMLQLKWIFGYVLCKVYWLLTVVNWFAAVFTIVVLSGDRYLAICHPVLSLTWRTPAVARVVIVVVWMAALTLLSPIIWFVTVKEDNISISCTVEWPSQEYGVILYTMLFCFILPILLISIFYSLVVLKLSARMRTTNTQGREHKRRKVTALVLTVIAVYVSCWLPSWLFQIYRSFFTDGMGTPLLWRLYLYPIINLFTYANSALNPLLYAFLSDNFRRCFAGTVRCESSRKLGGALRVSEASRRLLSERPTAGHEMSVKQDTPLVSKVGAGPNVE